MNIKNVWNHHLVIYVHLGSFVVWEKNSWKNFHKPKKKHSLWLAVRARSLRHVRWPHESDQWRLGCCWCCCCRCLNMISMIILHFHTWLHKDESCCISFLRQHILDTKVTLRVWHIGPRLFDLAFFLEKLIAHHSPTKNSSQKSPDLQLKWLIGELVSDIQEVTWNISKGPDLCGWSGHSHELQLQCTFPHLPPAGHRTRWKSSRLTWDP